MKSLTEFESKRLLNEFGLVSCKESVAKSFEEASFAASEIGYPIVLKYLAMEPNIKASWAELS